MTKSTQQDFRQLTVEELSGVSGGAFGGITGAFQYGDIVMEIHANKNFYSVATTNTTTGQTTTRTYYSR